MDDAAAVTTPKKPLPGWPKMMRRATAAAYLDLSEAAFERGVASGRLPMPVQLDGKDAWAQVQIDRALDVITGEAAAPGDWRRTSKLYADDPAYHPELLHRPGD